MWVPVLRSGVTKVTLLKHTGANITKLGEQVFSAIDPKNIKQLHSKNISIPKYKNTPFRINLYVFSLPVFLSQGLIFTPSGKFHIKSFAFCNIPFTFVSVITPAASISTRKTTSPPLVAWELRRENLEAAVFLKILKIILAKILQSVIICRNEKV